MIPRRQGMADINATIPVGNGQLPPIPEQAATENPNVISVTPSPALVAPSTNNSSRILDALVVFSKVSKKGSVDSALFKSLVEKKLVSVAGDYAVVSDKGLKYLVDFTL